MDFHGTCMFAVFNQRELCNRWHKRHDRMSLLAEDICSRAESDIDLSVWPVTENRRSRGTVDAVWVRHAVYVTMTECSQG